MPAAVTARPASTVVADVLFALRKNATMVNKAFKDFDSLRGGSISRLDFRRIISHFSEQLSDLEFVAFCDYLDLEETVLYPSFMLHHLKFKESNFFTFLLDVSERISNDGVKLMQMFESADTTRTGCITRKKFCRIFRLWFSDHVTDFFLNRLIMPVTIRKNVGPGYVAQDKLISYRSFIQAFDGLRLSMKADPIATYATAAALAITAFNAEDSPVTSQNNLIHEETISMHDARLPVPTPNAVEAGPAVEQQITSPSAQAIVSIPSVENLSMLPRESSILRPVVESNYKPRALDASEQTLVGMTTGMKMSATDKLEKVLLIKGATADSDSSTTNVTRTGGSVKADKCIAVVKELLKTHYEDVYNACLKSDFNRQGTIGREELHKILSRAGGFELSRVSLDRILHHINSNRDAEIAYPELLREFGGVHPRDFKSKPIVTKSASRVIRNTLLNTKSLTSRIGKLVVKNWEPLKALFEMRDWLNTGSLPPREFSDCLAKFGVRLNDNEVAQLVSRWGVERNGKATISYIDFLRHIREPGGKVKPRAIGLSCSKSSLASDFSSQGKLIGQLTKSAQKMAPEFDNMRPGSDSVYIKLRAKILSRWSAVRRDFTKSDPKPKGASRSGIIPVKIFREILERHGGKLGSNDWYQLHQHIDAGLSQGVKYDVFLSELIKS